MVRSVFVDSSCLYRCTSMNEIVLSRKNLRIKCRSSEKEDTEICTIMDRDQRQSGVRYVVDSNFSDRNKRRTTKRNRIRRLVKFAEGLIFHISPIYGNSASNKAHFGGEVLSRFKVDREETMGKR